MHVVKDHTVKIENFVLVNNVFKTVLPDYFIDFNYNPKCQLEGLSFTLWDDTLEAEVDEFTLTIEEVVEMIKETSKIVPTIEQLKDYMVIYAIFNNQMDKVIPNYNHEGWAIKELGISETNSKRYFTWEEIANRLKSPEVIVMNYEDLLEI